LIPELNQLQSMHTVSLDWIGLSSVLRPRQHSIGYMGDSVINDTIRYDMIENFSVLQGTNKYQA